MASAYARPGSRQDVSYGDWAALSGICDEQTANILYKEVSDGIIAAGYTEKALEILKKKRKGAYNILRMDPSYVPPQIEHKDVFGITFDSAETTLLSGTSCCPISLPEKRICPRQQSAI